MVWAFVRPDALSVLKDRKVHKVLGRYFDTFQGKKPAKFLIAKRVPAEYDPNGPLEALWTVHEELTRRFYTLERQIDQGQKSLDELEVPERSYLDLKADIARQILQQCHFCVRRCGANRLGGELGWCRAGGQFLVSSMFEHMGEEPELVPSGTIFTISCNLRCLHCQNWTISQRYEAGEAYTPQSMARAAERLRSRGCRNINMVGGDPTPWLHQWIDTFRYVKTNVPTVWNSNSYYSEETAKLLTGFIDVYLLDFKYGNNKCAERISSAPGYWEACTRNHLYAMRYGELIIRVLVLPEHLECCSRPILEWVAQNLGRDVRVNIMWQYRPEWRAHEVPELRRRLNRREMERSLEIARNVGLTNYIT
ncbi:MAG: radical SAM protein [Candidatus Bathyarchaeia archaeon]